MKRFEYRTLSFELRDITHEKDLNTYGLRGWEVCGVAQCNLTIYVFLKREIPDDDTSS